MENTRDLGSGKSVPLSGDALEQEVAATIPLSRTRAQDIANLREWAKGRATPA
jgi:hypothetical protein